MTNTPHLFGGDWTDDKLNRVRKYLVAYATIMRRRRYRFAYIDAFAGTGYRTSEKEEGEERLAGSLLPETEKEESQEFLDGSARIALQVEPRFHKYIFIEVDPRRYEELKKLRDEFPDKRDDIILKNEEANACLQDLCGNRDWSMRRAVLFLDPYGMQVTWETIEAIAHTKAIDLWLLFPLGIGVNRMLTKDGRINPAWRRKLDIMFGATDWYEAFYRPTVTRDLFGEKFSMEKVVNFDLMGQYFVRRLQTVFPGVAENPRPLYNSRNNPMYLLCFATGNPHAVEAAIKIAQDILRRD